MSRGRIEYLYLFYKEEIKVRRDCVDKEENIVVENLSKRVCIIDVEINSIV